MEPALLHTHRLASAGRALDKVQTGLKLVDTVLKFGEDAGLPLIPAVCSAARGVLRAVQASQTVINDALSAAQRTIDVLELLQLMAKNVERMDAKSRASVEDRMRELQRLLEDVRSAVAAFGKKGWLRHALNVKRRNTFSQLDSEITGQLSLLLQFYNLARDAHIIDGIDRLQEREYAVEAEVEQQVAERKAMGEDVDEEALEKDCEVVRGIAVASGVSDAEFQPELTREMREGFAQHGLKLDKIIVMMANLSATGIGNAEPGRSSRMSLYAYDRKPDAPPGQKDKLAARLGRGSFGTTYRMRKVAGFDARLYAVKMIESEELDGAGLEKEARLLSTLEHENTLRFYDAFWHDTDDGRLFVIVTELLTGGSLGEKIVAAPSPPEVATLMRQVASGLAYMHSLNLQHRDLKPANVLLDSTGRAKIIDFGLACLSSASRRSRTKTKVGTDAYMSPEKAVGMRYGPADDVWAAGCILAELLLGRTIGNVALGAAKRQRSITESKSASGQLGSWVEGCLQESPGRRPAAAKMEQGLASDLGAREAEERRREDAIDRSQAEERLLTPEAHRKLAPAPAAAKPAEPKPQFEIALAGGGLRELNQGRPGGGKLSQAATPALEQSLASGGPGAHEAEERRLREQTWSRAVAAALDENERERRERVRREDFDRSLREAWEACARQEAAENSSSSDVPTLVATPELVASGADDLLDLMGGGGGGATPSGKGGGDLLGGGAPAVPAAAAGGGPSPQWLALCMRNDGVLFEDATLQIGVKMDLYGHQCRMALFFGNKGQFPLQQLATVLSPCPQLAIQVSPLPSTLHARQQISQNFLIVCNAQFGYGPQVKVSFIGGSGPVQIVARLPLNPSKFFVPLVIDGGDFFRRWKLFEGKELQKIFKLKTAPLAEPEVERVCAGGMKMAVLRGVDPNLANYVVAGWMAVKGGAPKSEMASVNAATSMCRATVRASDAGCATAVAQIVQSLFAAPSCLPHSGGISPQYRTPPCATGIGDEGAKALASALRVYAVLTKLVLWDNNLGEEGKGVIRDAVSGRVGFELKM